MKKIIYTIAILLAAGTFANAQAPVMHSEQEIADFMVLENDLLVFTRKEAGGQYIYSERKQNLDKVVQKETALNTGIINTVIGRNGAGNELYVYQKNGRNEETITFYTVKDGSFEKTGERKLPKLKNHSANLGLYLSEDKNTLVVSAELGRSRGYEDLYVSRWESNRWSKPKNLGRSVNTRQAEFAPFVAGDTLYFARMQEAVAYTYSAPLSPAGVAGAPVKLQAVINKANTYNAYYKKLQERQMWISASTENDTFYTAYLLEPVIEEVVAPVEEIVQVEEVAPEPVMKVKAASPSATLFYGFNRVYLGLEEVSALSRFLRNQPEGTAFIIRGYSDGYGTAEAKDNVSRHRALQVKNYIEKYFGGKNFTITLENEVRDEKGRANRKTEIYLMQ